MEDVHGPHRGRHMQEGKSPGNRGRVQRAQVLNEEEGTEDEHQRDRESEGDRGQCGPAAQGGRDQEAQGPDEERREQRPSHPRKDLVDPARASEIDDQDVEGHEGDEVQPSEELQRQQLRGVVLAAPQGMGEQDAGETRLPLPADESRRDRQEHDRQGHVGEVQEEGDGPRGREPVDEAEEPDCARKKYRPDGARTIRLNSARMSHSRPWNHPGVRPFSSALRGCRWFLETGRKSSHHGLGHACPS